MRNLKKILALVLALVMSFSLMATASAFSDDGDIAADYAEAIDVLSGLEVFKGYDNGATFQPKGSITRAEVAAIIYRIATGDVKDAQTSIYSSWGQFNDVKDGSWYAGYVNYCANAGYIKGYDSKTFGPNDPVTGYQALAMILRAIGYDKNNEFTGSNWQVRTASIAKQRGITDNVTDTLLGQSATRELVAEVLFQSILVKTVTFNTNTLSYSENATSLGYDVLKLEKIEGVVVANQYADLADDEGMATGKTRIESADGDRTLNVVSTLDDIGESRYVYGIKTSNNGYNLVTDKMYDTGDNVVADKGEEIKVKDLAKEKSISVNDSTEYFINFDQSADKWTSDWLIRYVIAENSLNDDEIEFLKAHNAVRDWNVYDVYYDDGTVEEDVRLYSWTRTIKAGDEILEDDRDLMKSIFDSADRKVPYESKDEVMTRDYRYGEVYVGTTSLKDYSDTMSWKGFRAEYINEDLRDFDKTTNGNYLKLVDNNNDGIVEYALRTDYVLDEVVSVSTKDEKDTYYYRGLKTDAKVVTPDGGDVSFKLDDVILYAEIDGKCYAEVVTPVSASIKAISFKDQTVTTTDDVTYGQSAIDNDTNMDDVITAMDEQVEYNVYLDKFGFARAYELAQGSQYGLLTEMYPSRVNNGAYVNNGYWIAELMAGEDKAPAEYTVLNSYYGRNDAWTAMSRTNPFICSTSWTGADGNGHPGWTNNTMGSIFAYNYLREATGHLGMPGQTAQFDYDPADPVANDQNLLYSNTNVAKYTKSEDGVNLYTAAEYAYEKSTGRQLFYADPDNDGVYEKYTEATYETAMKKEQGRVPTQTEINALLNNPVYAVDYIQLNVENIKAGAAHYTIDATYGLNNIANYTSTNNYVDAVDDTEFFIVSGRSIQHFVGYKNMPKIDAKDMRAIYAVAENVDVNNTGRDYWVANVIVIEVTRAFNYDSVVMAYYNPSQSSRQAVAQANGQKAMSVVDSENAKIDTLIPEYSSWDLEWTDQYGYTQYGFYGVYDSAERDANTLTGSVDRLGANINGKYISYNDNDVYAGYITREAEIGSNRAYYIDYNNGVSNNERINISGARVYAVGYKSGVYSLKELNSYKELNRGDEIIIVKNAKGDVSFIIDIEYYADAKDKNTADAAWLDTEYNKIMAEQTKISDGDIKVNVYIDGQLVAKPFFANNGEHAGVVYQLAGLNSYDAEYWTENTSDGKKVAIDASLFYTIPSVTIGSSNLKSMIEFENVGYTYSVGNDANPMFVELKTSAIGNRVCYALDVNRNGSYVFDVHYTKKSGVSFSDIQKGLVDPKSASGEDVLGTFERTVEEVTPVSRTGETQYKVTVDFNLKEGYYYPAATLRYLNGGKDEALTIMKSTNSGYEYKVEFTVTGLQGVQVLVGAKSTENLTYTVTLDTDAGINIVSGGKSQLYYLGGENKGEPVVFEVTTVDPTYVVSKDVIPANANVTVEPDTSLVNGKWVTIWTITAKNLTDDTKIILRAVAPEDSANPVEPGDTTEPTNPDESGDPTDPSEPTA